MKIFIETLGCPKNFNDSEYAYGSFFSAGFKKADSISDADVVVVNLVMKTPSPSWTARPG